MTDKISGSRSSDIYSTSSSEAQDAAPTGKAKKDIADASASPTLEPPGDTWEDAPEDESWSDFLGSATKDIEDQAQGLVDDAGDAIDQVSHDAADVVDTVESAAGRAVDKLRGDIDAKADEIEQDAATAFENAKNACKAALAGAKASVEAGIRDTVADAERLGNDAERLGNAVADGSLIDHAVGVGAKSAIETRLALEKYEGGNSFMAAESPEQLEAHFQQLEPGKSRTFSLAHSGELGEEGEEGEEGKGGKGGKGEAGGLASVSPELEVSGEIELSRPADDPETYEIAYKLEGGASLSSEYGPTGGYKRSSEVKLHFANANDAHAALAAIKNGTTPGELADQFQDALDDQSTKDGITLGLKTEVGGSPKVSDLPIVGDMFSKLPLLDMFETSPGQMGASASATFTDGEGKRVIDGKLFRTETQSHNLQWGYDASLLGNAVKALAKDKAADPATRKLLEAAEGLSHRSGGVATVTRLTPADAPAGAPPSGIDVSHRQTATWGDETVEFTQSTKYRHLDKLAKILSPSMSTEELATQLAKGNGHGISRDYIVDAIIQHNLQNGTNYNPADFLTVTIDAETIAHQEVDGAPYTEQAAATRELHCTIYGDRSHDFAGPLFGDVLNDQFYKDVLPELTDSRLEQQTARLQDLVELRLDV